MAQSKIQDILSFRLNRLSPEQKEQEIAASRLIQSSLLEKIADPEIDSRVRDALDEYRSCLISWSQGALLDQIHPAMWRGLGQASKSPSGLDLALILQKEKAGCQTGVFRLSTEALVLWHTEEDVESEPGSRFDRLRVVSFPVQAEDRTVEITTFLYPDLLPGPTFGWRSDGYIQAVDTLFLKPYHRNGVLLANIASWVTLRLGGKMDIFSVIASLGPFVDGYALTCGWLHAGHTRAQTIEFAGEHVIRSALGDQTGNFLFQVNLFSKRAAKMASAYEYISEGRRKPFDGRILRTHEVLRKLKLDSQPLRCFYRLLCSRSGGDFAYANLDVKAHFVACLDSSGLEAWVGPGPAVTWDDPQLTHISIEL